MLEPNGSVRFQFNERISENTRDGDLSAAVMVSPLTGEVRVDHSRTSLSVSLEGGFRPGLLYRVTLLPVVSDMFGNSMRSAFELVFSTGGEATPTATLAGEVWDRLSGRGLDGATVQAVGADSLVHIARSDDQGVFAFRYLPTGDFAVTAFQDQDRDRALGPREARGVLATSVAEGDTVLVEIPVLAPDTTPAVVGGARALDSVTVVIEFDDYLDPGAPADQVGIGITGEGGAAPVVTRLFHEVEYAEYVAQVADSFARLDSIDAAARAAAAATLAPQPDTTDALAADSAVIAVAPSDSLAAAAPDSVTGAPSVAEPTAAPEPAADTTPARPIPARLDGTPPPARGGRTPPGRRLVGLLDVPLTEGAYEVRVTSVVNINGLPDGGGEVAFQYEPPPPPADTLDAEVDPDAPVDSLAVPEPAAAPDTLGLMP